MALAGAPSPTSRRRRLHVASESAAVDVRPASATGAKRWPSSRQNDIQVRGARAAVDRKAR